MNDQVIHFLKIAEVMLIAGIKFVFAPFEAERQGFNFHQAFFITTEGGFLSIFAFTFIRDVIAFVWGKIVGFFRKPLGKENKPKRKFTWFHKFIVRIKMRFGLLGLLLATPAIISIPLGTVVIQHFYRRKKIRNIFLLMLSVTLWSLILNGLAQHLKLSQYIPE